jgi:hypothetical protein
MFQTTLYIKSIHKFHVQEIFSKNSVVYEIMWKNMAQPDRSHTQIISSSCIFHAGFQRLQTHTQNVYYLLLSYSNGGCTKAPECYVYTYSAPLVSISFYIQFKHDVTINT